MKNWSLKLLTTLVVCACSTHANTITWKSGSSGNWSDTSNWNPKHVPGAGDTAVITVSGNYTVTLDVNASVGGLVLGATGGSTQTFLINGPTFTLARQATINSGGRFNLSSGTFKGDTNTSGAVFSGVLAPSGGLLAGKLTMATNSVLNLAAISGANVLSGLTRLTNYGTVNWSNTDLNGAAGLQIFNRSLWDAKTNNTFHGGGTVFNNYGTFRKSGGGTTTLDNTTTFNSTNTVDVISGTLAIQTGTSSGIFSTAGGTVLNLGKITNSFALAGSSTFTGTGIVEGNLNGNGAVLGGTVTFSAATLNGSLTISNTGVVNFVGTLSQNYFANATFNNYGTVNWSNTDLFITTALLQTQIHNYGLWDVKAGNTFHGTNSFNNQFYNSGTFRKSSGGTSVLDSKLTFRNTGTVDVRAGTLKIQNGYEDINSVGIFNIATNAEVNFSGVFGFLSYAATIFTGNGSISGDLSGASGGSNVISGNLTYLGGRISGPLTVVSNAVLNFPVAATFSGNIANYGTVNWISGNLLGSSAGIDNYGLWDAKTNNFFNGQSGTSTTFNNYGIFRKSGGTVGSGDTYFDFYTTFNNNSGTVDVQNGWLGFYKGTDSGTVNVASNALFYPNVCTLTGSPTFSGPGFISGGLTGNNAVVNGSLSLDFVVLSGTLTFASNTVVNLSTNGFLSNLLSPADFNNLILTNYGTITWASGDLSASSAVIANYGLWDAKTDNGFSGSATLNNYGIFRKSGGGGILFNYPALFNNSG